MFPTVVPAQSLNQIGWWPNFSTVVQAYDCHAHHGLVTLTFQLLKMDSQVCCISSYTQERFTVPGNSQENDTDSSISGATTRNAGFI